MPSRLRTSARCRTRTSPIPCSACRAFRSSENRGQAEEITIRGLQGRYTQTLVNGRPITTVFSDSLSNRNFQAYIMPSAFVSRLAVHKSGKADVQEGGIAGSVDIVTQRALEIGERRFNVSANGNWDGNNGEIGSDVTAMYADIFADDTLGILLGVNLVDEDQGLHRDRGGRYRRARNEARNRDLNGDGDFDDRGIVVRDNVLSENFEQQRDRQSWLANLEWEPSDSFTLFSEVLYSQQDTISPRESVRYNFANKRTRSEGQQTVFINDVEYVSQYHSVVRSCRRRRNCRIAMRTCSPDRSRRAFARIRHGPRISPCRVRHPITSRPEPERSPG